VRYANVKEFPVPLLLLCKVIIRGDPAVGIGTQIFPGELVDFVVVSVFLEFLLVLVNLIRAEVAWTGAGESSFVPYVGYGNQASTKRYNALFSRFSATEKELSVERREA
jgi:hypothetical protein